ncbi:MAG: FtsX-like permease family protein [Methermicoccaceae archaeon]
MHTTFLFESVMIGFVGGLLGIFSGLIVAGIISEVGVSIMGAGRGGETMAVITLQLILLAIGFSAGIGMVSGLIPARRAANLQPVEALRYE